MRSKDNMFVGFLNKIEKVLSKNKVDKVDDGWIDVEISNHNKDSSTKKPFGLPLANPSLPIVLDGPELSKACLLGFNDVKLKLSRYMEFCQDFTPNTLVKSESGDEMPLVFFAILIGNHDLYKLMVSDFGASLYWEKEKTDVYAFSLRVNEINVKYLGGQYDCEMSEMTARSIMKEADDEAEEIGKFFISEEMQVQSRVEFSIKENNTVGEIVEKSDPEQNLLSKSTLFSEFKRRFV